MSSDGTADTSEARARAVRRRQRIGSDWRHDPRLERMAKLNDEDPERFLKTFGAHGLVTLGMYESGKAAAAGLDDPLDAA